MLPLCVSTSVCGCVPMVMMDVATLCICVCACVSVDPKVHVVYVSPVFVSEDTMDYYHTLLEMGQSAEDGDTAGRDQRKSCRHRLHMVTPENLDVFSDCHMSLASVLLYSPQCLARIRRLVAGMPAYIVSGVVCRDDIAVADALGAL